MKPLEDYVLGGDASFLKAPVDPVGYTATTDDPNGLWKKGDLIKKDITKEAGQSIRDAILALKDVYRYRDSVMEGGNFNDLSVAGMSVFPSGLLTGKSRVGYQAMGRAIEVILRERSGAAVPPEELVNYRVLYQPNLFDLLTKDEEAAKNKFRSLSDFYTKTLQIFGQGRLDINRLMLDIEKEYQEEDNAGVKISTLPSSKKIFKEDGNYYINVPEPTSTSPEEEQTMQIPEGVDPEEFIRQLNDKQPKPQETQYPRPEIN